MFSFKDLSVNYSDGQGVLHNFSLDIHDGEIIALVGESGSGKTTAIRAAMGLLSSEGEITGGDLLLDGQSLIGFNEKQWRSFRGTKISMIFQHPDAVLNPVRTIGSQFIEFIRTHEKISRKDAYQKAIIQLDKMHLPHSDVLMKSIPASLSNGMKQRIGIAISMTFAPKILFADEPISSLDVSLAAQIIRNLDELRSEFGTSILIVTHNLAAASYLADRILVLQNGRIVEQGTSEQIFSNPQTDYTKRLISKVSDFRGKQYV